MMRVPLEILRTLITPRLAGTQDRPPESGGGSPVQPPPAPPPPEKSFNGWVDGINTHSSGITVILNRNADGTGGGTDKIWLLMSDTVGTLVDPPLVPYLDEFKRAQSHRLGVFVIYKELAYRNLVTSVMVFGTPLYTTPGPAPNG